MTTIPKGSALSKAGNLKLETRSTAEARNSYEVGVGVCAGVFFVLPASIFYDLIRTHLRVPLYLGYPYMQDHLVHKLVQCLWVNL